AASASTCRWGPRSDDEPWAAVGNEEDITMGGSSPREVRDHWSAHCRGTTSTLTCMMTHVKDRGPVDTIARVSGATICRPARLSHPEREWTTPWRPSSTPSLTWPNGE